MTIYDSDDAYNYEEDDDEEDRLRGVMNEYEANRAAVTPESLELEEEEKMCFELQHHVRVGHTVLDENIFECRRVGVSAEETGGLLSWPQPEDLEAPKGVFRRG